MKITSFTPLYPSKRHPDRGTFVKTAMEGLSRSEDVTVIAPEAWGLNLGTGSESNQQLTSEKGSPRILRPWYPSFSNRILPWGISTYHLTLRSFEWAAARATRLISERPDITYGHFLFPAGETAANIGEQWQIPRVAVIGESQFSLYEKYVGLERARNVARRLSGVIAVSEQNFEYAVSNLGLNSDKILLLPNAANTMLFTPRDRLEMRRKLGLPKERRLVSFVGPFVDRKGPLRLMSAVSQIPDIGVVLLGDGPQMPAGPQVLHAGPVSHNKVADWICSTDLFVMPTFAEGSPNSVLEAMACGLPIVGSDIPAMRSVIGSDAGILVEPTDVKALACAIKKVLDDPNLRLSMSLAALKRTELFNLDKRLEHISSWLYDVCCHFQSRKHGRESY